MCFQSSPCKTAHPIPHRLAANAEWRLLYSVAKDKDGLLQRETVRGVFDASLFERLQDRKKSS
jgi:peroxygenase